MPSTQHRSALQESVGELYVLRDERADSSVTVAPQRGAIVTSMKVAGRELLYVNDVSLSDPTQNVRGGIPVLFPSPGKLIDDTVHWGGRTGTGLKQHGIARLMDWSVVDTSPGRIVVEISSNAWTLSRYPWKFRAQIEYSLTLTQLSTQFKLENLDTEPLPFALGFHPYLAVSQANKSRIDIETGATQAFDNVRKQVVDFTGFDLTQSEVDLHLLDHGGTAAGVTLADGARIDLRSSEEFRTWVVWTREHQDFVCVEPWTAHANALNTDQDVIRVDPGHTHTAQFELEYTPGHPYFAQ